MKNLFLHLEQWNQAALPSGEVAALPLIMLKEMEELVSGIREEQPTRELLLDLMDETRKPAFLQALSTPEARNRWAEVIFALLQQTHYSLLDLFRQRVSAHPDQILFREFSQGKTIDWSYEQMLRHTREIAALFLSISSQPRVALYTENCLEGAATDLACLMHGIFVSPLSPHFRKQELLTIFNTLQINIVLVDSLSRLTTIRELLSETQIPFRIFTLQPETSGTSDPESLVEACKRLTLKEIADLLDQRPPVAVDRVITTMFTSGSTGQPKGVSFSLYHIVSKRFARAAALPDVGNQTFLCYLPLYHTFGRYLEMTGAIFWDGTYVFAGNTSAETLFSLMPIVSPSALISIPLRWQELYDRCQELRSPDDDDPTRRDKIRSVTGQHLVWGLSAAGYLDPRVFCFFNRIGIHLCSGFGMTEATGGITMTPPGSYISHTVGTPLPGVYTRLTPEGELELRGHYIARYLEDAGVGDTIPFPVSAEADWWLKTGDLFSVSTEGYYRIVDRVKDIYKNNRGQTVAPQIIEKKFFGVPGIKTVFLAGDHRPYNVLLIVPDPEDPICHSLDPPRLQEYYRQIITRANADVAPYERVLNFTLLDRDFSANHGEITSKGTFNRKTIAQHFHKEIDALYTSLVVNVSTPDAIFQIPKWIFRDLGILESDIIYEKGKLINRSNRATLTIRRKTDGSLQIGDLRYRIPGTEIDLGQLIRQPRMWIGNPAMIRFFPVKEGWDVPVTFAAGSIYIAGFRSRKHTCISSLKRIQDPRLIRINELLCRTMFGSKEEALEALQQLGGLFAGTEQRLADVMRHRIEALAFHPDEAIRTLAYRTILLHAPHPEDIPYMPAFIESGLSFLNEESIREIITGNFGKHRLDALKKRLFYYRTHLKWPASGKNRRQFSDMLGMLKAFALLHPEYYGPVRAELSRWILHRQDPWLSRQAEELFENLKRQFEKQMKQLYPPASAEAWREKVTFEYGISAKEKDRLIHVFRTTTFVEESIRLIYNELHFSLDEVPQNGIWVLRMLGFKEFNHYRMSINTVSGNHYDLHVVMGLNPGFRPNPDLFYWLASLAGYPGGAAVSPLLGSNKPSLGIMSTQYIGGLTAWDKIREMSEIHQSAGMVSENAWKKIFIKAFAVIFSGWHHSGYQIVPGSISPANVVIPESDFRDTAVILSLTGWSAYTGPLSLAEPMLHDFYCRTLALYPWCRNQLQFRWIFDGCMEALGREETERFLRRLREELNANPLYCYDESELAFHLDNYLNMVLPGYYLPLSLFSAIDQYREWHRMNPLTTAAAREQTIGELMELYRLHRYPDLVRYCCYRQTYFAGHQQKIRDAFDLLTTKLQANPNVLPIQLLELSELQLAIEDPEDREVFNRMVFPRLRPKQQIGFLMLKETGGDHVIVQFTLTDRIGHRYTMREPIEPREVGSLYQLFFRENYPKEPLETDRQLVVTDEEDQVVGGLTWRYMDTRSVLLDGLVVAHGLQGRGLGSEIIGNFFATMAVQGIHVVKAHFLFGNYVMKHHFTVDKEWGALVKRLV